MFRKPLSGDVLFLDGCDYQFVVEYVDRKTKDTVLRYGLNRKVTGIPATTVHLYFKHCLPIVGGIYYRYGSDDNPFVVVKASTDTYMVRYQSEVRAYSIDCRAFWSECTSRLDSSRINNDRIYSDWVF